jgi:hypothetical protein
MADFAVHIPWREPDEATPKLGDGISRPRPEEVVERVTVVIRIPGSKPMRWIVKAPTPAAALVYARNRWPQAAVSLYAPSTPTPLQDDEPRTA